MGGPVSEPVVVMKYRCALCNGRAIGAVLASGGRRLLVLHRKNSHAGTGYFEIPDDPPGEWCGPIDIDKARLSLAVSCRRHGQWIMHPPEVQNDAVNATDVTLRHPLKELKIDPAKYQLD